MTVNVEPISTGTLDLRTRNERIIFAALIGLALALRVIFFLEVMDDPLLNNPRVDALYHDVWAQSIAAGNVVGDEVFFRAPLYPYVLGFLYVLFGYSYHVVQIFQHLLGVCSVVLVYLLSRNWFDVRTSAITAFLVAVNPVLIWFEGQLLFETLVAWLSLVWLLLASRAIGKQGLLPWFVVGLVLGLLSITRPPFIAIGILFVGLLIWRNAPPAPRSRLAFLMSFGVGVALIVLPVTARNYVVGDDFVLIASQGGINFYIGNNPDADGISSSIPGRLGTSWDRSDQTQFVANKLGYKPTPSEESAYWYKQSLSFMIEQPIAFLNLLFKKMYFFWNHREIPNNLDFATFKYHSAVLQYNPFGFWLVGTLALVGLAIVVIKRHPGRWLLIPFVVLGVFFTVVFFVCDRFRLPLVPVLSIFAAYAIVVIGKGVREGSLRTLLSVGGLCVASGLLVNSNLYPVQSLSEARDDFSLGMIALNNDDYNQAIDYFMKALAVRPSYVGLRHNIGVAEWLKGDVDSAAFWFHQELRTTPRYFGSMVSLAQIYYDRRELDSAAVYAEKAMSVRPYMPAGYVWAAKCRLVEGNLGGAESILRAGKKNCPEPEFVYGDFLLAEIDRSREEWPKAESKYGSVIGRLDEMEKKQQPSFEPEFSYSIEKEVGALATVIRAKTLYGLGHVMLAKGRADSAAFLFHRATTLDGQYADAYADLGVTLLNLGRLEPADSALAHAIALNRKNYLYWFNYGTVLAYEHRLKDAVDALERSISLNPDFTPAREKMRIIQQVAGQASE